MTGVILRSPISRKALTIAELRRLPRDTELILFFWPDQSKKRVKVRGISGGRRQEGGAMVQIQVIGEGSENWDAETLGLAPMVGERRRAPRLAKRSGWCDGYCLVLPRDVNTLPTELHWSKKPL
jgi:hypothetical protein